MPSTSVFQGVEGGPASDAVVYDYGRSGGRTVFRVAFGVFVAFYVFIVVTADADVVGEVSRWLAPFAYWAPLTAIPLLIAAYGLLRATGVLRRNYGLALDPRGLWFRDRAAKTFFHIPWTQIKYAAAKTGLGEHTTAGLRVFLAGPQAMRQCRGLKNAKGKTKPLVARGETSVEIPTSGNLRALGEHFLRYAPDIDWRSDGKPGRRRKGAPAPSAPVIELPAAIRDVVKGLLGYGSVVAVLVLGGLTLSTVSGFQPGDLRGTVTGTVQSCEAHGPISGYGVGTWSECLVQVVEDGRPKVVRVDPPYLAAADVGTQVRLDRFERSSEYAKYDDYTPSGASHRDWLNYAVAVPLVVIGGIVGILALWVLADDLRALRASIRKRMTDRRPRQGDAPGQTS